MKIVTDPGDPLQSPPSPHLTPIETLLTIKNNLWMQSSRILPVRPTATRCHFFEGCGGRTPLAFGPASHPPNGFILETFPAQNDSGSSLEPIRSSSKGFQVALRNVRFVMRLWTVAFTFEVSLRSQACVHLKGPVCI